VNTTSANSISSTEAVVEGNLLSFGADQVYDYGFCWSNYITNPDASGYTLFFPQPSITGKFPFQISYLTPGMTYYIRAYAANRFGVGYGEILSFTTPGSVVGEIVFNPDLSYGSVSDIDGNIYKTIKIGSQTWMAENLKTSRYNDGTTIPEVKDQKEWRELSTGAYSWYINQSETYKNIYGALYNWYAVNNGKLCPKGWHVPSDAEWTILSNSIDANGFAGNALKEAGTRHWQSPDTEATNSTGFTALPGGYRGSDRSFYLQENLGYVGMWWSSSIIGGDNVSVYSMSYIFNGLGQQDANKKAGLSCRCLLN
jgi:uncharacterized protein (TIGR02145 family)